MYKLHLILKYLRTRRIAWISLGAVTLCTAMVLVVISVMGGWLDMFRQTNHALIGDLVVYRLSLEGFPYYEEMIDRIEKLPEVKAASPEVRTFALLKIGRGFQSGVEAMGIDLDRIGQVNGFLKSLHLQSDALREKADEYAHTAELTRKNMQALGARAATMPGAATASTTPSAGSIEQDIQLYQQDAQRFDEDAAQMRHKADTFPNWDRVFADADYRDQAPDSKADVTQWPSMIVGSGVIGLTPDENGNIRRDDFMYTVPAKLMILRASGEMTGLDQNSTTSTNYWIVDDSRTGVYQIDDQMVYVPFNQLQVDLQMNAQQLIDPDTLKPIGQTPARCNEISVGLKDGFDPHAVEPKIEAIVDDVEREHPDMVFGEDTIRTQTWDERQADILEAVEHEKALLVILFAIVSIVAVFLIFCIFYMIVVEKTRDIGIIKSVGATNAGVAAIFLGYGFVIGIVGSGLGLLLGYLVVHNINELHKWLGDHMGIHIWNAKTYLFDTIPNTMRTEDVVTIVSVAILASVLGAVVPAIRAARMHPVEALRWE